MSSEPTVGGLTKEEIFESELLSHQEICAADMEILRERKDYCNNLREKIEAMAININRKEKSLGQKRRAIFILRRSLDLEWGRYHTDYRRTRVEHVGSERNLRRLGAEIGKFFLPGDAK